MVLDVGVHAAGKLIGDDGPSCDGFEGHLATNLRADRVITAAISCPRFCNPRANLDSLISADAAGDARAMSDIRI